MMADETPECFPCRGWDVFDLGGGVLEIQRCDTCEQYPDDDVAEQVALAYLRDLLKVEPEAPTNLPASEAS
jgi:hypothetical protein